MSSHLGDGSPAKTPVADSSPENSRFAILQAVKIAAGVPSQDEVTGRIPGHAPNVPSSERIVRRCPVRRSQTATVLSLDPETMRRPSGFTATDITDFWCPASVWIRVPASRSQTATVLSSDPETMHRPSGLTATEVTASWSPVSRWIRVPASRSQTATVLSS